MADVGAAAGGSAPSSSAVPPQAVASSKNLQKKFPTAGAFASWLNSQGAGPVAANGTDIPAAETLGAQFTAWYKAQKGNFPQYSLGEFEYTFLSYAEFAGLGAAVVTAAEADGKVTGAAASASVSVLDGLGSWETSLTGLLGDLTSASLWVRVAKVVVGGTLLIVGVAKLTGADKAVGGALGTAVKAAPLL